MKAALSMLSTVLVLSFVLSTAAPILAQSRPQRPEPSTKSGDGKRNSRPTPKTEEELKKEADEKKRLEEEKNSVYVDDPIAVDTDIVSFDAVVVNKKTGQIVTGLKKANFQVFEDGVKKEISNFTTPDAPITTTNRPSVKVVIRPLMMLPSFNRIVSANAAIARTAIIPIEAIVLKMLREAVINPPFGRADEANK